MRKICFKILFTIFFLYLFPLMGKAQKAIFHSEHLNNIAKQLSQTSPETEFIYKFVERYIGELKTFPTQKETELQLYGDNVSIDEGNLNRLELITSETTLAISSYNNKYIVLIANGDYPLLQLTFPMSCQLILGKDLLELENDLIAELQQLNTFPIDIVQEKNIIKTEDIIQSAPGCYIYKGESYHIESINSSLYYRQEKKNKEYQLVFNSIDQLESMSNMMINEYTPCDITIKINIRKYGFKREEVILPLKQWIAYMRSKGNKLYFGIESKEVSRVNAVVFVVNEALQYNHLLNVRIPYSLLTAVKGEIKADMNVFIPTHNIQTLFDEYSAKKNKYLTP